MARNVKGRLFTRGKKNFYYIQYYLNGKQIVKALKDDDGKSITNRTKAEKAANIVLAPYLAQDEAQRREQAANALKTAKNKAEDIERKSKYTVKFSDGWEVYRRSQFRPDSGPDTIKNYQGHYNKFVEWLESNHPKVLNIASLKANIAIEYASFLEDQGLSRNTYNKHINFMKLFYKVMLEEERVANNPFEKIKRKKQTPNSRRELNVEQIYNLLSTAKGEMALLLGLGYFTGMRRGDCCTLLWSEVDLARKIITRIPNKIRGRATNVQPVKIGIAKYLFNALSQIHPKKRNNYILPQMAEWYLNNKRQRINTMIKKHFASCGINTVMEGTGEGTGKRAIIQYGFHSLRYSYISHHAEAGTPQAIIQANAGHSNPAMTEHYTKISDDAALKVASAIDITPTVKELPVTEPEREELRQFVENANLEDIIKVLQLLKET